MRVAVLGAGYAGLTVARRLERSLPEAVEIVVVDESSDHLVKHELHRVIRHPDLAEAITVPLERILSRAEIRQATVTAVDAEEGVATLEAGANLDYDFAAVCLGAETAFYDLPGVEEHALPLQTLDDARSIREATLDAAGGTVVVGGAGLSGIQVAGELFALSSDRDLDIDITLVEMADRIAPEFDSTFGEAVRRELDARGVGIETGVAVESANDDAVTLADGRSLPADVFVWTGGIRGPTALGGERRPTPRDLRVSDTTFVVGDAATVTDQNGSEVPASAQTAVRQARVAAQNIVQLVDDANRPEPVAIPVVEDGAVGDAAEPSDDGAPVAADERGGPDRPLATYESDTIGWVVSIGDSAVARVGPVVFSGEPAKVAKASIGFGHLGSVGAIRQASALVAEELGWPTVDSGLSGRLDGTSVDTLPTDPASPGALGESFTAITTGFGDVLAPSEPIDLTAVTRQSDPDHPGSAMASFKRTLSDTVESIFETGDRNGETTGSDVDADADRS